MSETLVGKTAIVTGASSGIGQATAEELARLGARVVISARRKERLEEVSKTISAKGGKVLAVAGDASKEEDVEALVRQARDFGNGRLDIVVVNAGRGLAGGMLTSDTAQWRELFNINALGAAVLMRSAGLLMAEQGGGDIIVISSTVGQNVSPFSGFYGATKFAAGAMAEALRREICAKNVRVTTVKPGIVASEFQQVAGYNQENFYRNIERFGKLLDPIDVARVIAFIVSQPPTIHINDITVRPTKQDYP